jgi:hypothetical protein
MLVLELPGLELHGGFLAILNEGDFGHRKALRISRSLMVDSLLIGGLVILDLLMI